MCCKCLLEAVSSTGQLLCSTVSQLEVRDWVFMKSLNIKCKLLAVTHAVQSGKNTEQFQKVIIARLDADDMEIWISLKMFDDIQVKLLWPTGVFIKWEMCSSCALSACYSKSFTGASVTVRELNKERFKKYWFYCWLSYYYILGLYYIKILSASYKPSTYNISHLYH